MTRLKRSTMFSHEAPVAVKFMTKRERRANHFCTSGWL